MNTRILRMCASRRGARRVRGLGQLQPVIFSIGRLGSPVLRIETATPRGPAYASLPLPQSKATAKKLFAALETAKLDGTHSDAVSAWSRDR